MEGEEGGQAQGQPGAADSSLIVEGLGSRTEAACSTRALAVCRRRHARSRPDRRKRSKGKRDLTALLSYPDYSQDPTLHTETSSSTRDTHTRTVAHTARSPIAREEPNGRRAQREETHPHFPKFRASARGASQQPWRRPAAARRCRSHHSSRRPPSRRAWPRCVSFGGECAERTLEKFSSPAPPADLESFPFGPQSRAIDEVDPRPRAVPGSRGRGRARSSSRQRE